ncbi:hypothetical protein L873DRAFT_1801016 [Choiromyces venosus 120613-1]|uniref:Uncharacterized protein n=1 Tax=Choiromyces venosus 120613-1 TaxID=1336337 RepID=A0A3N4K1Z0_9PEZI|nr:hypothetical protein L873DRAFT_1801016 [Choiromyces venosus 120613-1]
MTRKWKYSRASSWCISDRILPQPQALSPRSRLPLPEVLAGATESERRLFAAAIFRTPKTLSSKERALVEALPQGLLQSQSTSICVANRWACKVHELLNGALLQALFTKVRHEAWGTHLNTLVYVKDKDARELVANLRMVSAYWIPRKDYKRIYMESPPRDHMYQDTRCTGCLLAAIAGDIVCLEALRIAIYSRKHRGGRLVPWIDAWIGIHGKDALHRIRKRSETVGRIIRNTRRTSFNTLEQQAKKDKQDREKSFLDELKYKERKLKSSDPFSPEAKSYWEEKKPDHDPFPDSHAPPPGIVPNLIDQVDALKPNLSGNTEQTTLDPATPSFYGYHFNPFSDYYDSDDDSLTEESGYTSEYSAINRSEHYKLIERNVYLYNVDKNRTCF